MANKRISRVPLRVRVLLLLPLVPIIVAIYWLGQNERVGLFESSLLADSTDRVHLPAYLPASDYTLADTIQSYDAETLYKKIDGHDVAFFRFGFELLTCASYGGTDRFVDVYVYRMNRRENALGIFAGERSGECDPLMLRDAGYRSGGGVFFYRGKWYVQITPSDAGASTAPAVAELVDSLLAVIPEPQAALPQLIWFPGDHRIPLSEGYLPDNAFGTDFLGDLFTAEYDIGGTTVTAFRSRSDSTATVVTRYVAFLADMASPLAGVSIAGRDVQRFSSYGDETWITSAGDDLIGLMGIADGSRVETLMEELIERAHAVAPAEPQS